MKFIRKQLDKLHPQFIPGGKLEKLYPLYEAIDTFFYTPDDVTAGQTHIRDSLDLKRAMSMVVVALMPCIFMAMYNTGLQANIAIEQLVDNATLAEAGQVGWRGSVMDALGVGYSSKNPFSCLIHGALFYLPIFLVTQIAGGFWEVLFASVRKHEINEGFLVTGMLFPLTLPASIPLWQVALGISFGVVIGKEIFGGTGKNFLNPALTGRAFLYFAYSGQMIGTKVWVPVDGHSAATSLGALSTGPSKSMIDITGTEMVDGFQQLGISWNQAFVGFIPGSMGETSTLACLFGAVVLVATGVGSWRIMLSVLIGALGSAMLFNLGASVSDNPMFTMPPQWHLVTGGFAFGLVFMATDPVSAAMTQKAQWAYGISIGVITTLVRVINPGYPEGIMLAILMGNVLAPLFDHVVLQANINRRLARSAS